MRRPNINRYVNQEEFERALKCNACCCKKKKEECNGCSMSFTESENQFKVKNDCIDLTLKCKNKK